jgi:hypothetical protein
MENDKVLIIEVEKVSVSPPAYRATVTLIDNERFKKRTVAMPLTETTWLSVVSVTDALARGTL